MGWANRTETVTGIFDVICSYSGIASSNYACATDLKAFLESVANGQKRAAKQATP